MYTELKERDVIQSRTGLKAWVIGTRDTDSKRNLVISYTDAITQSNRVELMSLAECQRSFPYKATNA